MSDLSIKREKFIPFQRYELVDFLSSKIKNTGLSKKFKSFCSTADEHYHEIFYNSLDRLKKIYTPFDPDMDTLQIKKSSQSEVRRHEKDFIDNLKSIITAANYTEITKTDLLKCFLRQSPWGLKLKVDFDEYEWFYLFYKGQYPDSRTKKIFYFFKKHYDFDVYSRVIFVFKLKTKDKKRKDNLLYDKIYMKIFKNVPTVDLEMLFPNTKVFIKLFDKLMIIVPLIAGIGTTIFNIAKYLIYQGRGINPLLQISFWGLVGGFFGIALRSFFDYKKTVERYLKNLTTSLYFQNLDNNLGVIECLLDQAREEELKEIILGYYFLINEKNNKVDSAVLDEKIEMFFNDNFGKKIDFDINDSIKKLKDLKVLTIKNKYLYVLPVEKAIKTMQ
jgi:hypothetical protein